MEPIVIGLYSNAYFLKLSIIRRDMFPFSQIHKMVQQSQAKCTDPNDI